MENEEQETIDRIEAQIKRLQETFSQGMEDAIEFHADMRARINLIAASQQQSIDILKGIKDEL